MLVLESHKSRRLFRLSAINLFIAGMTVVLSTSQIGIASIVSAVTDGESDTVSVLVDRPTPEDGNFSGELKPKANEKESIQGDSAGNATYTAQVLSPAPQPPQDMLIPESPTEKSFTSPVPNELRGERTAPREDKPIVGGLNLTDDEGTKALGTFASSQQSFQAPSGGAGVPTNSSNQFGSQSAPAASQFGPPIGNSSPPPSQPSVPAFSSGAPSMSGARPKMGPPMSGQPGEWRNVPPVQESNGGNGALYPVQPAAASQRPTNSPIPSSPPIRSANATFQNTYNAPVNGVSGRGGNVIQPSGFNQPIVKQQSNKSNIELAKTLIARYSTNESTNSELGRPTKLIEMVQQPISTQLKRPMVHQYWEAYYDWANHESDRHYEQWLKRLPNSASPVDKSRLDAEVVVAANRSLSSEIQLGRSQAGLVQYMPTWDRSQPLPIPNDIPLIHRYKTNYDLYSQQRQMPNRLRGIDQMLPKTLILIGQRARAVQVTKQAADTAMVGLNSGQADLDTVLSAGRRWRDAERDLIASTVSYNQAIGDFALSVAPTNQTPQQVVKMLLGRPRASVAQVTPASARSQPNSRKSSIVQQPVTTPSSRAPAQQFGSQASSQFGSSPVSPRSGSSVLSSPSVQPGSAASKFSLGTEQNKWSNQPKPSTGFQGAPPASPFKQPTTAPIENGANSNNSFGASNAFGPTVPGQ